jgi:hypothetical protein
MGSAARAAAFSASERLASADSGSSDATVAKAKTDEAHAAPSMNTSTHFISILPHAKRRRRS